MDIETKELSETQSMDTIIELKTHVSAESSSTDIISEKNSKPSPLDITAAQELVDMSVSKTSFSTPPLMSQILDRRKIKERKIGHRRVDEIGQITFKKIQTTQIMGSIQLGIGHAIGSLASKPERDLLMQDFTIVETTLFSKDGSNMTPAHHYSDFRFKAYAPVAFRYFRDLFGIQPDDYLMSLCNDPMRELTNPGASGSIFYLTDDDEFIIKTVQHKEAEFLQKLLPGYYMNLNQNPRTLLPKFFGLYCYQCGGKNVRLVVMNNLLPSSIKLHEKYDLKGSTYKRKASKHERKKESPTYKDLDFIEKHPDGIYLEADTYNALTKTIQRDCRVLESFKIMDYSLLVGIHNVDLAKREKMEQLRRNQEDDNNAKVSDDSKSASPIQTNYGESNSGLVRSKSINRQRLAAFSTAMESIQVEIEAVEEDVPSGGIPAKNVKGEHLFLFLGIIDILQSYRMKKKLEHTLKSVLHDGDTVSVHRPGFYAQRFQEFMSKTVFRKSPASQHRKFKTMVTSVLALKHSPSRKKGVSDKQQISEPEVLKTRLPKIPSESENAQEDHSTDMVRGESHISPLSKHKQKLQSSTDPPRTISLKSTNSVTKVSSVTWDKTEVISLSQVIIQTDSAADCVSETSSSSTSGFGSTLYTATWTPPHSIEVSTPTHTEGTPSFTESSSSGDAACPTTPVQGVKSLDCLPSLGETHILQDSKMTRL